MLKESLVLLLVRLRRLLLGGKDPLLRSLVPLRGQTRLQVKTGRWLPT